VDSWATLKTRIDKYDNGICKGWREELDTILTFVCSLKSYIGGKHIDMLMLIADWSVLCCSDSILS